MYLLSHNPQPNKTHLGSHDSTETITYTGIPQIFGAFGLSGPNRCGLRPINTHTYAHIGDHIMHSKSPPEHISTHGMQLFPIYVTFRCEVVHILCM